MRRADWQQRLTDAISTGSTLPFTYGVHDCVVFTAYCIDRMCDTTYARDVCRKYGYDDEDSANDVIYDGGGLETLVSDWLGDSIPVALAQPGDVVLIEQGDTQLVGIIEAHQVIAATHRGITPIPLSLAICAWRIA